ncbi:MAG: GNAT family N-acetyltransferase [Terriglobales bacterium]|jgi:GNAT superfamily N-acetyltransferase
MLPDGFTDLAPGKIASVVTFLEMRARPARDAAWQDFVSTNGVRLRLVPAPDLNWYRALYRRAGSQWLWFSRLEMTDEQLAQVLHSSANELFVAEHEGSEIGMAELDRSHAPDVEVTFFGLFPEAMGKRLGRSFMAALLERAWDSSAVRVWLHTCNLDAPAALPFYLKCGFRVYKQAIEVADDPRVSGILPEDAAPHVPIIR